MPVADRVLVSARGRWLDELTALDGAVRAPLALSTRVGFTAVTGGVGCSTVGGLVASTCAARRSQRVLAVNATSSEGSLLWHAGCVGTATSTPEHDEQRLAARTGAEAVAGLARTGSGAYCLDLADPDGTPPPARWWQGVGAAGRFFDLVVTDWGVATPTTVDAIVAASTVVAVVTDTDRGGVQAAVDLAAWIRAHDVQVVVAVVDVTGRRPAGFDRLVQALPFPGVLVGHDRALRTSQPAPARRLRAGTSLAVLRLAAALIGAGGPGGEQTR